MKATDKKKAVFDGGGIVIFQEVTHAISGEKVVKKAGFDVKLVAPPLELRMGCDLALEVNLVEQAGVERALKESNSPYVKVTQLKKGTSELLGVVKTMDYGRWLCVKSGNMKISYDKETGKVVNISGGGCPDIPYLHAQMLGKTLPEAPRPKDLGYTLCAMMLDRAYEECLSIYMGEGGRK